MTAVKPLYIVRADGDSDTIPLPPLLHSYNLATAVDATVRSKFSVFQIHKAVEGLTS